MREENRVFFFHLYSKKNKVKLVIEFTECTIIWWDQIVLDRTMNGERHVET